MLKYGLFWMLLTMNALSVLGQMNHIVQVIPCDTFTAGETVVLRFDDLKSDKEWIVHCHSSLGSVILKPEQREELTFEIPPFIANKAGLIDWVLLDNQHTKQSGKIYILPQSKVESMETYLGPPDILAGGEDYSMFVSVPTDTFDNPMLDNTPVNLEYYFKSNTTTQHLNIEDGLVFHRIFSPKQSGRIFAVSECLGIFSKEYDVNIQPALPTDFQIYAESNHYYADGNQVLTFKTSVLVDSFKNVVSDGTMVEFYIKNKQGDILRTRGITQEGVAIAEIVHPEYEEYWEVKAIVVGMAESNSIVLNFEQVINTYQVLFENANRTITLGPLESYMNQRIPDGFKAHIFIYKDGELVKRQIKDSKNGYVIFKLDPNEIQGGQYDIHFEVAGIRRTYQHIKL